MPPKKTPVRAKRPARAPSPLLVGPGLVFTPDGLIPDAGVLILEDKIVEVGAFRDLKRAAKPKPTLLDAHGGLILPGAINAHSHFYTTLARGMAQREPAPANFLQILERVWWPLDRALTAEDIEVSTLLGLAEAVRCGVTTLVDHHSSPNACKGSLDVIRKAVDSVGLRAALCYEVSDRDGPEAVEAGIAENLRFAHLLDRRPSDRVVAVFGLHAPFTLSEATLERCVDLARAEGLCLHLHAAEDRADVGLSLARHGERPLVRLDRHTGLSPRTILAHCVHLNEEEMALLAATRAFVIHNPESNMNNGVGTAQVPLMLTRGVRVGLGTDGMGADLFGATRTAYLLHRLVGQDPRLGWDEVAGQLWDSNAALASMLFGRPLGELAAGAAADLIVADYDPPTPLHGGNAGAHLVLGVGARHVASTVVAGRVLMRDRELLTLDEGELRARARERAAALWQRI
jgi:putative selenium metabolism protein SsnA